MRPGPAVETVTPQADWGSGPLAHNEHHHWFKDCALRPWGQTHKHVEPTPRVDIWNLKRHSTFEAHEVFMELRTRGNVGHRAGGMKKTALPSSDTSVGGLLI